MPRSVDMSVRCLDRWPKQYYGSLKASCFADVFESPACSLATFGNQRGEEKTRSVLVLILNDLTDFFNVGNSMNAAQILTTAEIILNTYGWLKVDDFKLCFNQAKRGLYGQVYRMDGNIILSWIEQYIRDRINAADEISYAEHASAVADERRTCSFMELVKAKTGEK
jgi:hypothetical protein